MRYIKRIFDLHTRENDSIVLFGIVDGYCKNVNEFSWYYKVKPVFLF
jgi:hypothetical protein